MPGTCSVERASKDWRVYACTVLLLQDIAEAGGLPERFLAKIFRKLARQHVVRSQRGAVRGYSLERSAEDITMREILEATEGPGLFERCAFWPSRCNSENPCVIHRQACFTCHMAPDHPNYEAYTSSKHGSIYAARGRDWDWTKPLAEARWEAPTCAYCHMLYVGEDGSRRSSHNMTRKIIWGMGVQAVAG